MSGESLACLTGTSTKLSKSLAKRFPGVWFRPISADEEAENELTAVQNLFAGSGDVCILSLIVGMGTHRISILRCKDGEWTKGGVAGKLGYKMPPSARESEILRLVRTWTETHGAPNFTHVLCAAGAYYQSEALVQLPKVGLATAPEEDFVPCTVAKLGEGKIASVGTALAISEHIANCVSAHTARTLFKPETQLVVMRTHKTAKGEFFYINYLCAVAAEWAAGENAPTKYFDIGTSEVGVSTVASLEDVRKVKHDGTVEGIAAILEAEL